MDHNQAHLRSWSIVRSIVLRALLPCRGAASRDVTPAKSAKDRQHSTTNDAPDDCERAQTRRTLTRHHSWKRSVTGWRRAPTRVSRGIEAEHSVRDDRDQRGVVREQSGLASHLTMVLLLPSSLQASSASASSLLPLPRPAPRHPHLALAFLALGMSRQQFGGEADQRQLGANGVDVIDEFCEASIFEEAAKYLSNTKKLKLSNDQKLAFYAFYKQATIGPCNTPKPGLLSMYERTKWNAWNDLGRMSKDEAIMRYVHELEQVAPSWKEAAGVLVDNDSDDEGGKGGGGDATDGAMIMPQSRPIVEAEVAESELSASQKHIWFAAGKNDLPAIKAWIAKGVSVNAKDEEGRTSVEQRDTTGRMLCRSSTVGSGLSFVVLASTRPRHAHVSCACLASFVFQSAPLGGRSRACRPGTVPADRPARRRERPGPGGLHPAAVRRHVRPPADHPPPAPARGRPAHRGRGGRGTGAGDQSHERRHAGHRRTRRRRQQGDERKERGLAKRSPRRLFETKWTSLPTSRYTVAEMNLRLGLACGAQMVGSIAREIVLPRNCREAASVLRESLAARGRSELNMRN